jgi:hypothetical protein
MKEFTGLFLGLGIFILVLLLPLDPTLLPLAARYTAAVTLLMVVWWITEALPIYATALVPLFLFPIFGILLPDVAARAYADQTVFLFMGGFFIAVTMQRWNLHRRITLSIVERVGQMMENYLNFGTDLLNPDFARYAENCGDVGFSVRKPRKLKPTLENARKLHTPLIVDIETDSQKF